jgi:hypothetical protein
MATFVGFMEVVLHKYHFLQLCRYVRSFAQLSHARDFAKHCHWPDLLRAMLTSSFNIDLTAKTAGATSARSFHMQICKRLPSNQPIARTSFRSLGHQHD